MKNLVKVVALSALTLATTQVFASTTANFDATLQVTQALTLTNDTNLDFGSITTADNTNIVVAQGATGATQSANFTVKGEAGRLVNFTVPASIELIHDTDATNKITVTLDPTTSVTLNGTGDGTLSIGGTADIASATLKAGSYSVNTGVSIVYQ
ncbi:DUF4402 domain-containing protein [Vibrio fluminensis]|uniref:DUF4402 domain-containing protein n=1 Tax=Vibrio fluminensis TaxID=2783614 RepID=UPI001888F149|nr:DUF4402 domain-containing protein [Vibrio fluminensis]